MNLIRYNRPLFPRRFSDVFDQLLTDQEPKTIFQPKVSISENEKGFTVLAEIPGVDKRDIDINLEENSLTIKGEKKFKSEEEKDNFHLIESSFGAFSRTFYLPDNVNKDKIKADFENGVLNIFIPKEEVKKLSTKIKIN